MEKCDEAALLSIQGMRYGEVGATYIVAWGKVLGTNAIPEEYGVPTYIHPELRRIGVG